MPRPVAHLANLDLNLLVALRERSVTRAAERLGVTQPAASAALARLRRHFGDELLMRDRGEYTLTALGAQLAEQTDAVCAAAERLFAASADFDPASPSPSPRRCGGTGSTRTTPRTPGCAASSPRPPAACDRAPRAIVTDQMRDAARRARERAIVVRGNPEQRSPGPAQHGRGAA